HYPDKSHDNRHSQIGFGVASPSAGFLLKSKDKVKDKDLTVQPIKLPGKQVKILSDQFPFWICSDIRHWGRVTWPDESSEVQVTRSVASKHEGRSESEHVVEAS
ncbi:MAG: hypothetical protein Q7V12_05640, partial [Deltaproteobacteria bacterium]|nr:hypothetical protein [Deltaproteobacteria bacterium]